MYLKRTPVKAGRVYFSIADGYYDRDKKYSKQITVEKLGYLDDLEKEYDDPISHFSRRVEELKRVFDSTVEKRNTKALTGLIFLEKSREELE